MDNGILLQETLNFVLGCEHALITSPRTAPISTLTFALTTVIIAQISTSLLCSNGPMLNSLHVGGYHIIKAQVRQEVKSQPRIG